MTSGFPKLGDGAAGCAGVLKACEHPGKSRVANELQTVVTIRHCAVARRKSPWAAVNGPVALASLLIATGVKMLVPNTRARRVAVPGQRQRAHDSLGQAQQILGLQSRSDLGAD